MKKKLLLAFLILIIMIIGWIIGSEVLVKGIWQKTFLLIIDAPFYFLGLMVIPLVSLSAHALIWRTILSLYDYKKRVLELAKYILGDFGFSFVSPLFGGGIGKVVRVALLTSSGVKITDAISSLILEGLIFAAQSVVVVGSWIILTKLGIVWCTKEILFWLEILFILILLAFLLIYLAGNKRVLSIVRKVTRSVRLTRFLKGLNEGFTEMFSLKIKVSLPLFFLVLIWYVSGLIEIWCLIKLIGVQPDWQILFLIQFTTFTLFILMPTPLGFGTIDTLIPIIFMASGASGIASIYFIALWRVKNLSYATVGLLLVANIIKKKFRLQTKQKKNAS